MSLLSIRNSKDTCSHPQSLVLFIQCAYLKGSLLDIEALLLNLTEYFNFFDTKTILDCILHNNFSDHISFHPYNCSSLSGHKFYLESFDYLYLEVSFSFSILIVITNKSAIPY